MKRALFSLFAVLLCLPPLEGAAPARIGQWIWSLRDASLYRDHRLREPSLDAAVFIGTVSFRDGRLAFRRALSPNVAGDPKAAVVLRFDDSVHALWTLKDAAAADEMDKALRDLLTHVDASGSRPAEIQLDYDCPERFLKRWASALLFLSQGALSGREVWITSLIAHIRHDDFGDLFRSAVAGHILQVFDTGDRFNPAKAEEIRDRTNAQKIPFRLGLGAFERVSPEGAVATDHGRWQAAVPLIAESPWYRGLWIFPAGQPWNIVSEKGFP